MVREVLRSDLVAAFESTNEADFAYAVEGVGRFRVNAFRQRGAAGLVFRRVAVGAIPLADLGLPDVVGNLALEPRGLVLVTGPTGSGKTTTLYSVLNEMNEVTTKVITTEDPVEYEIYGLIQVPVNPEIDVTFATVLRAILRHDPDIILVGEIRDYETAEIAIQSALTGHVVFSTLHTNDAPTAITRLRDMGVPPFLITATVESVLAQRLVRKICVECRTQFDPSDELLMELQLPLAQARKYKFYYGKGCQRCNNTGYKGRTGIHELIDVTDDIRDLIATEASVDDIANLARSQGMTSLRESGLKLIFDGVTTIDEVVRETVTEGFD
jgi:type IV pilus assembly protein PilB